MVYKDAPSWRWGGERRVFQIAVMHVLRHGDEKECGMLQGS